MAVIRHPHIVVYVTSFEDYCLQTRRVEVSHRPRPHRPREVFHMNQQTIKKHTIPPRWFPFPGLPPPWQSPLQPPRWLPYLRPLPRTPLSSTKNSG
jgi:hypothetical protein